MQTGETAFNYVHGVSLFEYLDQSPEAAKIFNANVASMTSREAHALVNAYDFSSTLLLVYIGGGHGALTTAILQMHPKTHAILFDLPSIVEETRRRLTIEGIADRCEVIGGNFFEAIPRGGDTYILKDVLHNWDDELATTILRTCRQGLNDSAKLLLIERVLIPGNDPMIGKLIDISMRIFTGGMERTAAEYSALLEAAGFQMKQIFPSDAETSVIEAVPVIANTD